MKQQKILMFVVVDFVREMTVKKTCLANMVRLSICFLFWLQIFTVMILNAMTSWTRSYDALAYLCFKVSFHV